MESSTGKGKATELSGTKDLRLTTGLPSLDYTRPNMERRREKEKAS